MIDIPNKIYNALTHTEFDANLVVDEMRKSIVHGTLIPINMEIKDKQAKLCNLWSKMTGYQAATESAISNIEKDNIKNITDDILSDYARMACNNVSWGNAEPEYEVEDFYCEEPNVKNVLNYLRIKYDLEKED